MQRVILLLGAILCISPFAYCSPAPSSLGCISSSNCALPYTFWSTHSQSFYESVPVTFDNYICYTTSQISSQSRDPLYWMHSANSNTSLWIKLARHYFALVGDYHSFLTNRCCASGANCTHQAYFQPSPVYSCFVYTRDTLKSVFPIPEPNSIPLCSSDTPIFPSSVDTAAVGSCLSILREFSSGSGGMVPRCDQFETTEQPIELAHSPPTSIAQQAGLIIGLLALLVFMVMLQGLFKPWLLAYLNGPIAPGET